MWWWAWRSQGCAIPTANLPRGHDTTPYWLNRAVWITVRTSGDPLALAEAARRAVWEVEPTVPVTEMGVLDDYLREHRSGTRNQALLIPAVVVGMVLLNVFAGSLWLYFVAELLGAAAAAALFDSLDLGRRGRPRRWRLSRRSCGLTLCASYGF